MNAKHLNLPQMKAQAITRAQPKAGDLITQKIITCQSFYIEIYILRRSLHITKEFTFCQTYYILPKITRNRRSSRNNRYFHWKRSEWPFRRSLSRLQREFEKGRQKGWGRTWGETWTESKSTMGEKTKEQEQERWCYNRLIRRLMLSLRRVRTRLDFTTTYASIITFQLGLCKPLKERLEITGDRT